MSSDKNASTPVIDWDSAPEGFPVWIEDVVPFGDSASCWAKDAGSYYLGVNGSKWNKPGDAIFCAHHRTQSIAEIIEGADRAVFDRANAYVVKDCSPVMAAALTEQLRSSMSQRHHRSIVLMNPSPVDFQASIACLDPQLVQAPQIGWDDAPEGTTHCLNEFGITWYRSAGDGFEVFRDHGQWTASSENLERLRDTLIARPAPREKWSLDGKDGNWNYDTLAELIIDCYGHDGDGDGHPASGTPGLYEGDTIYRAIEHKDDPADFLPDAGQITETMWDKAAMSDAGEWVDDFPALDDDSIAALELALEPLKAWARKHCQPDFFTVKNVTPHILTVEDVRAAKAQERAQ